MKRIMVGLLMALALPTSALAVCYTNGPTYCYSASECPSGTTWRARDQQCVAAQPPSCPADTTLMELSPGQWTCLPKPRCHISIDLTNDPKNPVVTVLHPYNCTTEETTDALVVALKRFRGL